MKQELPSGFPERIKQLRRSAGLSQARLAEVLNVSEITVRRWETGRAQPSGLAWQQILRAEVEGVAALEVERDVGHGVDRPGNLPLALASFIGRQRALSELAGLLPSTHLLSLTGAGGSGKTRLALELGYRVSGLRSRTEENEARGEQAAEPLSGDSIESSDTLPVFPDGIWLVELGPLSDPALAPQAVASVLGLREQPGRATIEILVEYCCSRSLLILLDNCEHLLDACASLVTSLLQTCPGLRFLLTSREALGIAGETVWPVPPLSLPAANAHLPAALTESEAVRLFVERARAVRPDFVLDNENAAAVLHICQRLDGLPLALELAAVRVMALSAQQIDDALVDRFRLLVGGKRRGVARHQAMRAAVQWSYDLLSQAEQQLFRRLSVFAGGFDLAAAEVVRDRGQGIGDRGGGTGDVLAQATDRHPTPDTRHPSESSVLDLLQQLIEKSLVLVEEVEGAARYRLLETVREYGREQLTLSGEGPGVQRRHAEHFLTITVEATRLQNMSDQVAAMRRGDRELDNLRAALRWAVDHGEAETALRLSTALWRYWEIRWLLREGRGWLAAALARKGGSLATRADALNGAGFLALRDEDLDSAEQLYEESLILSRELGHPASIAGRLQSLGLVAYQRGDYAVGRQFAEEALRIFRELDDRPSLGLHLLNIGLLDHVEGKYSSARAFYQESLDLERELRNAYGIATSLHNLGVVAYDLGELHVARACYEECLSYARSIDYRFLIFLTLNDLGHLERRIENTVEAASRHRESLRLSRDLGDREGIANALRGLAILAAATQQWLRAARLHGAAEMVHRADTGILAPYYRADREQALAAIHAALDDATFDRIWAEGAVMTFDQAIAFGLDESTELAAASADRSPERYQAQHISRTPSAASSQGGERLTPREAEVLGLIAAGRSNRAIAAALYMSLRTVEHHITSIYEKLGVTSKAAATAYAIQRGLLRG
ncbi:MAG: tetratricopeptide repeat protein [Dehalococcoidia bacterium]